MVARVETPQLLAAAPIKSTTNRIIIYFIFLLSLGRFLVHIISSAKLADILFRNKNGCGQ